MKKFLFLLILIAMLASCKTRKVGVQIAEQEESASVQLQRESAFKKDLEEIKQMVEESRVSSFNQALSLTPVLDGSGVAQPVSYVENRNGKPFREIYITGGSLSENKQEHDSMGKFELNHLRAENLRLSTKLDSIAQAMVSVKEKEKEVKVTGGQFGVYVIVGFVLLLLVMIGYLELRLKAFQKPIKDILGRL